MSGPAGCLGCNHDAVAAWLTERGADLSRFVECPPTRHAWPDVIRCNECGRFYLIKPAATT